MDASIVEAPKQRNTKEEKADIKAGRIPERWKDKPHKLRQKDRDARWTLKRGRVRIDEDGREREGLLIPAFGYKNHVSIDRRHGIIRRMKVTDAAAHDGARLREGLIDPSNTASDVWADTAYRSAANEEWLARHGRRSRVHHRKPKGKPMPAHMAHGNRAKSRIRAKVEHVFAEQKERMGLFIRTFGLKRAEAMITLANMAYNMKRWCWLDRRGAPA